MLRDRKKNGKRKEDRKDIEKRLFYRKLTEKRHHVRLPQETRETAPPARSSTSVG